MGRIGIVLSIISDGYMMTHLWSTLRENPILIAKLALVVVTIIIIGLIEGAAKKSKYHYWCKRITKNQEVWMGYQVR